MMSAAAPRGLSRGGFNILFSRNRTSPAMLYRALKRGALVKIVMSFFDFHGSGVNSPGSCTVLQSKIFRKSIFPPHHRLS
jgi:hypothetical protein